MEVSKSPDYNESTGVQQRAPRRRTKPIDTKQLVQRIAQSAIDKKATDLILLDVRKVVSYTDYILICSASSDRQVRAVADGIKEALKKEGIQPVGTEGARGGDWVLMDYSDVVVHVFQHQVRVYYDVDDLWPEASEVPIPGYDRTRDVGYANFA